MSIFCYRFGIVTVGLVKVGVLDCFDAIVNFVVVIIAMAGCELGDIIHSVIKVRIHDFDLSWLSSGYQIICNWMGFTKHQVNHSSDSKISQEILQRDLQNDYLTLSISSVKDYWVRWKIFMGFSPCIIINLSYLYRDL